VVDPPLDISLSVSLSCSRGKLTGADQKFAAVTAFVTRTIKRPSVFLYCTSCFCPSPDENLGDLRDCFALPSADGKDAARGELIIHYSLQEAWG
jgi:hypothetical protein